jgi:membrane fusion protein
MTPQRSLFRQEAIEFQQYNRQWGQVALLQPLPTKVMTWVIATAVATVITFLFLGQYARKETVDGYLTPTAGTSKIFVPQLGTIKEIYVKEGQEVQKGQPLLIVETSQIAANDRDVNTTMLDTLVSQRDLLINQITAEQDRTKSEQERLTALINGLETEISEVQAQIEIQNESIRVADALVSAVSGLRARGNISEPEFRQRELAALALKQNLRSLNQQLAARHNQLIEMRFSFQQLPTVMAQKIQNIRTELSATEQRITEINGRRAYIIRASTVGRASTLQATVGQHPQQQCAAGRDVRLDPGYRFRATRTENQDHVSRLSVPKLRYVHRRDHQNLADDPNELRCIWTDRAQGARLSSYRRARPAGY